MEIAATQLSHEPNEPLRQRIPWRQAVKLVLLGCAFTVITNFPSAFTHTSVNTAVAELREYLDSSFDERGWDLNKEQQSMAHGFVNSCWFVGQIAGSMFSPLIADKYGRKREFP